MRVQTKKIFVLTFPFLLLLALSQTSSAHTSLYSSNPSADSVTVEFPDLIELEFNEPLLVLGENRTNYFDLFGPSGKAIGLEPLPVGGALLAARVLDTDLDYGDYTVSYRIVAGDGHVLTGEFGFSYEKLNHDGNATEEGAGTEIIGDSDAGSWTSTSLIAGLIVLTGVSAILIYVRAGSGSGGN